MNIIRPLPLLLSLIFACAGALVAQSNLPAIPPIEMEMVLVDRRNNEADKNGLGSVDHDFKIGKFDVTAAQWCAFLNAVAKTGTSKGAPIDPYGLYNDSMKSDPSVACIKKTPAFNEQGEKESISYDVYKEEDDDALGIDRGQFPITYISYFAAVRFCNWLSNGQPNTGVENESTTEDGPYTITNDPKGGYTIVANFGTDNDFAKWPQGFYRLPTENEWYKAAYYQKTSDRSSGYYWLYSTGRANQPGNSMKEEDNQPESPLRNVNYHLTYEDKTSTPTKQVDQYTTGATPNLTKDIPNLTPVGIFKNSPGPFGTFDMGGNVEQWTDPQLKLTDDALGNITFGGSWQSATKEDVSSQHCHKISSSNSSNNIGFRVVLSCPHPRTWPEYWGSWWNCL